MTDTNIYFGRPGNLLSIPHPKGTFGASRYRPLDVFELGAGGVRVDRMVGGARTYKIPYAGLLMSTFTRLQAFADGHEGPGPFAFLDPGQRNMLPPNIAGATSVTNSADGVNTGSFAVQRIADDCSATVSSGFGTTSVGGFTWTVTGTASDYSKNGLAARMSLGSLTSPRRAQLLGVAVRDIDLTVTSTISATLTGGGAQSEIGVRVRYVDANNFVDIRIFRSATNVTVAVRQMMAGVETVAGFPGVTGAAGNASITMRIVASGTSLQGWAWVTGGTPTTAPLASLAGLTMLSVGGIELNADLNASVTNGLPLIVGFDDLDGVPSGTPAASDSTFSDAGPRTLAWTDWFTGLTFDWPSSTFSHGVPVVSGRALCFSCYVRGGGTDAIVTYTPRLFWRDAAGVLTGTVTSGTPVASSSGAWAQMFATATPPAGAAYADMDVRYTSGVSTGSIGYLRRFMLNEGSTPDAAWAAGTGVWPVKIIGLDENWVGRFSDFRSDAALTVQEDTS